MSIDRRLAELGSRYRLPREAPGALGHLLALIDTEPAAPTALREPAAAIDAHVADALVALELGQVRAARRIADLGSGAGFPGLVLAAALPAAEVALVEANRRKCAFLERAVLEMGLGNATIVATRVESWVAGIASHDLVSARAVAPLPVLVEYAAPLLVQGGALVAWKGRRDAGDEAAGVAAAAATGLELAEVRPVRPWVGAEHLHLHLYLKVRSTPERFPRRPGMASKRPLRAST